MLKAYPISESLIYYPDIFGLILYRAFEIAKCQDKKTFGVCLTQTLFNKDLQSAVKYLTI